MKLLLKNVRLAFPDLFTAKSFEGSEPSFGATFLLSADDPQVAEVNAAIDAVAEGKWGAKAPAILKQMRAGGKVCLRDGDEKANYDGFEGNFYISTRSKVRPLVADRDRTPLTEADGVIYAGCYVYATLELWPQDNQFGKRVNAQLKTVQFFRDGDAFSGGARPGTEDDLVDLSEGADSDLA
jgi:hypothetical protein